MSHLIPSFPLLYFPSFSAISTFSPLLSSFSFTSDLLFTFLCLSSFFQSLVIPFSSSPLLVSSLLTSPFISLPDFLLYVLSISFPVLPHHSFFFCPFICGPSTLRRCTRSDESFPGPVPQYVLERACLNWHGSCHRSAFRLSGEGQISRK